MSNIKLSQLTELSAGDLNGANTIFYVADLSVSPNVSHFLRYSSMGVQTDFILATQAYAKANTAVGIGYNANIAYITAQAAFNQANAAFAKANSAYSVGAVANAANDLASAAFLKANTAYSVGAIANTANIQSVLAFNGANAAYAHANSAYNVANNAVLKTGSAITGIVTAPTATVDTSNTMVATTAFVIGQGYLKTSTASITYAPIASPALTGLPTAPTPPVTTANTVIATTGFVYSQGYLTSATAASTYATLASPAFNGAPTAPTAALGTSNTMIATTAFVTAAIAAIPKVGLGDRDGKDSTGGQNWADYSTSRGFGTTYTNTTSKPVCVHVRGTAATTAPGSYITAHVGPPGGTYPTGFVEVDTHRDMGQAGATNIWLNVSFIVPTGNTYVVTQYNTSGVAAGTLTKWSELR